MLGNETPSRRNIERHKIEYSTWKRAVHTILMVGARLVTGESWQQWIERLKAEYIGQLNVLGKADAEKEFKNKFKGGPKATTLRELTVSPAVTKKLRLEMTFQTIHQVKGAESEFVAHFVPRPAKESTCLSVSWWDNNNQEERRIAFVAASRASKTYLLAIHKDSYGRLFEKRKEFVDLFEVIHEV